MNPPVNREPTDIYYYNAYVAGSFLRPQQVETFRFAYTSTVVRSDVFIVFAGTNIAVDV